MKLFTGWVMSAGLVVAAGRRAGASAGALRRRRSSPYRAVSDIGGPYAAMPPEARVRAPGYGPRLLPPQEVYTVLRESGFSPLGIPRQRGFVYTISVIDRGGDDGRLVIDARTGRILRFLPAYRMGDNFDEALTDQLWPAWSAAAARRSGRAAAAARGPEGRKPRTGGAGSEGCAARRRSQAAGRHDASRAAAQPAAAAGAAVGRGGAGQTGRAADHRPGRSPAAAPPVEAKPAPQILPTQDMPKAQGLE